MGHDVKPVSYFGGWSQLESTALDGAWHATDAAERGMQAGLLLVLGILPFPSENPGCPKRQEGVTTSTRIRMEQCDVAVIKGLDSSVYTCLGLNFSLTNPLTPL